MSSPYPTPWDIYNLGLIPYKYPLIDEQPVVRIPVAGPAPYNTLAVLRTKAVITPYSVSSGDIDRQTLSMPTALYLAEYDKNRPEQQHVVHSSSATIYIMQISKESDFITDDDNTTFLIAADEVQSESTIDDDGRWVVTVNVAESFWQVYAMASVEVSSWVLCYEPPPRAVNPSDAPGMHTQSLTLIGEGQASAAQGDFADAAQHDQQAIAILRTLVSLDASSYETELAVALSYLGDAQFNAGAAPGEFAAGRDEAAGLYLAHAARFPDDNPEHRSALANAAATWRYLSQLLANHADYTDAITYDEKAIPVYRTLVSLDASSYETELAVALSYLGDAQFNAGAAPGEFAAGRDEAAGLYLAHAARFPDDNPEHRSALANAAATWRYLSQLLANHADYTDAITYDEKAIPVYRTLVSLDASSYETELAVALSYLGDAQFNAGAAPGEFAAGRDEAAGLYLAHAARFPDDNPEHRSALANAAATWRYLSQLLANHADYTDAITYDEKAIPVYRTLVSLDASSYETELAVALSYLGDAQFNAGAAPGEFAAGRDEAAGLYLAHAARFPDDNPEHRSALANAAATWRYLSQLLANHADYTDAITYDEKAIPVYRTLVSLDASSYETELAVALSYLGDAQFNAGAAPGEFAAGRDEAAGLYLAHAARFPDDNPEHRSALANAAATWRYLSQLLANHADYTDAITYDEKAIPVYRTLVSLDASSYETELAVALSYLGDAQFNAGAAPGEFAAGRDEAAGLYLAHAARFPDDNPEHRSALANAAATWRYLSQLLANHADYTDAITYDEKAIPVYRTLVSLDSSAYQVDLDNALAQLAAHQAVDGQPNVP